jgi:tetratricopeptide (TPR) repeat protein
MVSRTALVLALFAIVPSRTFAANDAKAEFEIASELFKKRELEAALPHFERAYELSGKRPSTIRGLAQCEWALEMHDRAIQHFREYLATNPPASERVSIEETIKQIEEEREKKKAAAPPPPPPPAPAPEVKPTPAPEPKPQPAIEQKAPPPAESGGSVFSSPVFWIVTGAVVVATVVVIIVAAGGCSDYDEVNDICYDDVDLSGLAVSF